MNQYFWISILLWLVTPLTVAGQPEYVFRQIDQEDGLSATTVDFFQKSTSGHMFFATLSGLNKYDGHTIEVYREQSDPGFMGTDIQSSFFEAPNGKIWFTTGKAIVAYDQTCGTFQSKILGNTESGSPHYAFFLEQDRYLWTIASQQLFRFDTDSISYSNYSPTPLLDSTNIKRAVVKTNEKGVVIEVFGVFNTSQYTGINHLVIDQQNVLQDSIFHLTLPTNEIINNNFSDICISPDGYLYLLTRSSFIHLDSEQLNTVIHFHPFPSGVRANDLQCISPDELWILTDLAGIQAYDSKNRRWLGSAIKAWDYAQRRYLSGGKEFFLDRDSILWICRKEEGLFVGPVRPADSRSIFRINDLPNKPPRGVFVDPNQHIWATHNTNAQRFFPRGQLIDEFRIPRQLKPVVSQTGLQYVRSVRGLSFIGVPFSSFQSWEPDPAAKVTCFDQLQLDSTSFLLATFSGIIYWNIATDAFHPVTQELKELLAVGLQIIDDKLWISTGSSQVIVVPFDKNRPDTLGSPDTIFHSLGIFNDHYYQSELNTYWVGSPNGLYAFDPENLSYRLYTIVDGLPSQDIKGILPGPQQELWLSSAYGIFPAHFDQSGRFIRTKHYTVRDGLSSNEYQRGIAVKHPDGSLWFGSSRGLDRIQPDSISDKNRSPKIFLAELLIHNQPWSLGKSIHHTPSIVLKYFENSLQFRLAAMDFLDPNRTSFQVLIQQDGGDIDTLDLKQKHIVPFPNLAPGSYRFGFTAQSAQGVWAPEPHWLAIRITPPFWKTWWFWLLITLTLFSAVVAYLMEYYRARNAENQRLADLREASLQTKIDLEEQRRLITSRIHNEMGGQLTTLNMLSSRIKNAVSLDKAQELNERINDRVRETRRRFSSFLRAVNPQFDELQKSMQLVKAEAAGFLQDSGIQSSFDWPEKFPGRRLPPEFRLKLFELIQEILNNIAKSADAQSVALQLRISPAEMLELTILDDGSGFVPTAEDFEKGIGLGSLQQISKELNGKLTYELRKNKGTRTQISLPLPSDQDGQLYRKRSDFG
ncbi:MAG: ATP-binding protein [Bacteroidota bacterium]